MFSGQDALAATASSDTDENTKSAEDTQPNVEDISEDYYDEAILREVAAMTEIDYDLVNFYAHSHEANAGLMLADTKKDVEGVKQELATFLKDYSTGDLVNENSEIEDEDWYVAPDEVSKYATIYRLGLADMWTSYFTSKSFITQESQYWGLNGFTMGNYVRWPGNFHGGFGEADRFLYTWAWVNEGESYTFGLHSTYWYGGYKVGAMEAKPFFRNYLSGYWFDATTGEASAADTSRNPDGSRKTITDYEREYDTSILPSNSHIKTVSGGAGGGDIKATISADAPSGVYYMQMTSPYNNGNYRFVYWNTASIGAWNSNGWSYPGLSTGALLYGTSWSYHARYVVILHRGGITAPTAEFETGVSNDLMSKTTTYNGDYQTFTLNNDWGPGLISVSVNSSDVSVYSRPALGAGVHGKLVVRAKNIGNYVITLTPFNHWQNSDGTTSTASIEYKFNIEKRIMESTYIVQEEGVDQAAKKKFLYETGRDMYISLYPVPRQWLSYTVSGLSEYVWSDNGVLTLSGRAQGVYEITVSLKDPANMAWNDPLDPDNNEPLVFTFEIGPMKVTVPDIIQEAGVDGGNLKKEVTYNGSLQTMSFMPVNTSYLNVDCGGLPYTLKDNVLMVTAQDAGTYVITISAKSSFIWETESPDAMVYTLIINEAEIDAPRFVDEDAVGNTKKVKYGGEKLANGEDWVATMTFEDCNEACMDWSSNTLSQQGWGDTKLVLAGRNAGTYNVTFTPKKNYKWKKDTPEQQYTLIIEQLCIAEPQLVNDGPKTHPDGVVETGYEYSSTRKAIAFDGLDHYHSITLHFPTSDEASHITYDKSGSVDIIYNTLLQRSWSDDVTDFSLTYNAAGTYDIRVVPTPNYCWTDGTSIEKEFTFVIKATGTPSLGFYQEAHLTDTAREWRKVDNYDYHESELAGSYFCEADFNGMAHRVRIGGLNSEGEIDYNVSYINPRYHFFDIVDQYDVTITNELIAEDWWEMTDDDGYLTLSFVDAGVYRIRLSLVDTNFCWAESQNVTVMYTIRINARGVEDPVIDRANCSSDIDAGEGAHFEFSNETPNTMYAIYYNTAFTMAVKLPYSLEPYVNIVYTGDKDKHDGQYVWDRELGLLLFKATERGDYEWTISIKDTNYAWKVSEDNEIVFKLHIARSGVSGVEMHYFGADKDMNPDSYTLKTDKDVIGGESKDTFYEDTFSEYYQYIYVLRTDTSNLVNTGFNAQFSYELTYTPLEAGYEAEDPKTMIFEDVFDENGLKLHALNAGTYTVSITPTDNYTWKSTNGNGSALVDHDNITPVTFTFRINKLTVIRPTVIADEGDDPNCIQNGSTKTVTYNRQYQPLTIGITGENGDDASAPKYAPYAYKLTSFEYTSGQNLDNLYLPMGYVKQDIVYGDIRTEDIFYKDVAEAVIRGEYNLAAQLEFNALGEETGYASYSVWAKSSGSYRLIIEIDNVNNYQFNSSDYCTYFLNINQLGVDLPEAYLLNADIDPDNADSGFTATSEYLSENGKALTASSLYQQSVEYDAINHNLYVVGGSIADGDFTFDFGVADESNRGGATQAQPKIDGVTPDPNVTYNADPVYRLTARTVNTYTVGITFVTKDFYWKDQGSGSGSTERHYSLVITTKRIDVPKIEGEELQIMRNHSYYKSFPYLQRPEQIKINGVYFGEVLSTLTNPSDTNGAYSYINARVSSKDNSGTTAFDWVRYEADNEANGQKTGWGHIDMFTSRLDTDPAQVTRTYCIELNIDVKNTCWNTNGVGDVNTKYYYISIEKASVALPFIDETKTTTGEYLYRTYTGEAWAEELKLELDNDPFMTYTLQDPATMDAVVSDDGRLFVSAPAPVGTYTVTVNLRYPDNMEWKDTGGSMAPLNFYLVVQPIKVAKPVIYVTTTEGEEGVVGWKKTVTYNYTEQFIQIRNFWKDDDNRWMTMTVANGTFTTSDYEADHYTAGEVYGDMVYNGYNNGLLRFGATNAGTYIVRFTLTGNAVWADNTSDSIDVTFVIEKLRFTTPYIEQTAGETNVTGTTKTYTFNLEDDGSKTIREMKILEYDESIMEYVGVTGGTESTAENDGYIRVANPTEADGYDGSYYLFQAANADSYIVTFKIKNFENTRWEYADNETISFTLKINKMTLDNPALSLDYAMINETIESSDLEVDYDMRTHTLLVENIVGRLDGGNFVSNYMRYADTTATNNPDNTNALELTRYDDTAGLTVKDIFGETYSGDKKDDAVNKTNVVTASATIPGVYYLTVSLADPANMAWMYGSDDAADPSGTITFTLTINKIAHDAPKVLTGTSSSKEYEGGEVEFAITNIYNGKLEEGGAVVNMAYEGYELVSYEGNAEIDIDEVNENSSFQKSWSGRDLVLNMSAIGTYVFRVYITQPEYVEWNGTAATETTFTFTITKRNISGSFSFSSDDEETNAALQTGSNQWAISTPVRATLTLTGLRAVDGVVDDVLGLKLYYANVNDPATELYALALPSADEEWSITPQDDGTYTLTYVYDDIPFGRGNLLKGSYMIYALQTDTDGNYALAEVRQRFTVVADPAPFKTNFLTWNYSYDTDADGGLYDTGAAGREPDNRLHLPYLTDGGIYQFDLGMNEAGMLGFDGAGYDDIVEAMNSWQVTWDGVYGGTQRISHAGNYEVSVKITAFDPDFYAFDDYVFTLYITIDKALYDLSTFGWDYDGSAPFTFDGNNKAVNVLGDFPEGLSVSYVTDYSFTSGTTTVNNQRFNGNTTPYAGEYVTTAVFRTPANSNYETPVQGNNSTYTGNFDWTRSWTVEKQMLTVHWATGTRSNSDGDQVPRHLAWS